METADVRPALVAAWPDLIGPYTENDGDPTRRGLSYLEMGTLANFIGPEIQAGRTASMQRFFDVIERCLEEGTDEVVNLMTVGFLEDLQNTGLAGAFDSTILRPYLGPRTLRAWDAVSAFWSGLPSPPHE